MRVRKTDEGICDFCWPTNQKTHARRLDIDDGAVNIRLCYKHALQVAKTIVKLVDKARVMRRGQQ